MKRAIISSKQVGDVYYMCESLFALRLILKSGEIKMSSKKEKSIRTRKPEYFASLTRNFKSLVAQKPAKWRDGIILDGTKLSDNYAIDSYNFAGWSMENQSRPSGEKFKISQITEWLSKCMIRFVGWSKDLKISQSAYEDIRDVCLNGISEEQQRKCRLQLSEGKIKRNGEIFIERLKFNTPGGSPTNIFNYLSDSTRSELARVANQYEERIHGPKSSSENTASRFRSRQANLLPYPVVHIENCVKGVVFNLEDSTEYPELAEDVLEIVRNNYTSNPKVITYDKGDI